MRRGCPPPRFVYVRPKLRHLHRWCAAAAALALLVGALLGRASAPEVVVAAEPATGMAPTQAGVLAANMPGKPLKGQKRPPCGRGEVAINGGCWVETKKAPPCNELYRYGDACYVPIGETKGAPVSQ